MSHKDCPNYFFSYFKTILQFNCFSANIFFFIGIIKFDIEFCKKNWFFFCFYFGIHIFKFKIKYSKLNFFNIYSSKVDRNYFFYSILKMFLFHSYYFTTVT